MQIPSGPPDLKALQSTFSVLVTARQAGRGIALVSSQVENLVELVLGLNAQGHGLMNKLEVIEAILEAYVDKYGEELLQEFAEPVIEGEIVDEEDKTPKGEAEGTEGPEVSEEE